MLTKEQKQYITDTLFKMGLTRKQYEEFKLLAEELDLELIEDWDDIFKSM